MKRSVLLLMLCLGLLYVGSALAKTYTTSFPTVQNPISEGGNWTSGSAAGTCGGTPCYYDFRIGSVGFAYGTMPVGAGTRDSTAILTGTWGLNQTVTATA